MTLKPPDGVTVPVNSFVDVLRAAPVNVKYPEFGAVGDNATDDTAAIQAAIDAVYAAGGGTVYIPPGDYRVTTLTQRWLDSVTVNIVGGGKAATTIRKYGAGTDPIFDFSADTGVLETYSEVRDLRIVGTSKAHDGIQIDACAYWGLVNVEVRSCDRAVYNLGGLVGTIDRCVLSANAYGIVNRLSAQVGGPPPNLIAVRGTVVNGNSGIGIDHGSGQLLILCDGSDVEGNGTAADTASGGLFVRDTVDDAIGYGQIVIRDTWFESNLGRSIQAYSGDLLMDAVNVLSPESGRSVYVDGCRMLRMQDCHCPSPGDTVNVVSATTAVFIGGVIATLTSAATNTIEMGVQTSGGAAAGFTGGLNVNGELRVDSGALNFGGDASLYRLGAARLSTDGSIEPRTVAGTDVALSAAVSGDANERFKVRGDGAIVRSINGSTAADVWFLIGTGSPEGVVAANVGSIFQRRDGGAGTSMYVKESGTGNTGWVAK